LDLDELPPSLQELTLVADAGGTHDPFYKVGTMKVMPQLRRFTLFGAFELPLSIIAAILCLHPRLEEVHFYRPVQYFEDGVWKRWKDDVVDILGRVQEVLLMLHHKPVVKVSEVSYKIYTDGPAELVIGPTLIT
jgi:hypothetical protein